MGKVRNQIVEEDLAPSCEKASLQHLSFHLNVRHDFLRVTNRSLSRISRLSFHLEFIFAVFITIFYNECHLLVDRHHYNLKTDSLNFLE